MSATLNLRVLTGAAIVALAALLVYLPCINGGFLFDDDLLLTNNRLIKSPVGLWRFWCSSEPTDYWPVSNSSLWIEWRLWGMNPTGYHVTNLILHIVEALLIWTILRKLAIPGAFLAALIFAVHPVNVESVAWISSRKNLMAMLFFLLSILWHIKAQTPDTGGLSSQYKFDWPSAGRQYWFSILCFLLAISLSLCYCLNPVAFVLNVFCIPWYWLSLVLFMLGVLFSPWYGLSLTAFVLAMLSKGSTVVLPVILLGVIFWRRKVTIWDLVRITPFLLVGVKLTLVNIWFQTHGLEKVIRTAGITERLLGAGGMLWFYLYKALLPIDLAFVYPQWSIKTDNLLWWLPLTAAVGVTVLLCCYRRVWGRPFLFAWGFYCVSLFPVLGFTDVGFMRFSLVADRYQHIPIIGVIALAAAGWGVWRRLTMGTARRAATFVAIAATGALILLAAKHSWIYRDATTLYQAALDKNPGCWFAYNNLGSTILKTGRPREAMPYYFEALRLKPDYAEAHNNLGSALSDIGQLPEALAHYQEALRLKPDYLDAHNNLGVALIQTGRALEAIEHYLQVMKIDPYNFDAHNNMGNALVQTGHVQQAIEQYRQALLLNPEYVTAYYNLGVTLLKIGRPQEAMTHLQQALRLEPNHAAAHNNLGLILADEGRLEEAFEHFRRCLKLQPNYVEAHNNFGNALIKAGRLQEAMEHYQQALQIKPDFVPALYNIGVTLLDTGHPQEAVKYFVQAIQLEPNNPTALTNLGNALSQTGRAQEAIEHYQQALKLQANSIEIYYNLALAHASLKQSEEALAAAQKALELARSKGQSALEKKIEQWLNSYRENLSQKRLND